MATALDSESASTSFQTINSSTALSSSSNTVRDVDIERWITSDKNGSKLHSDLVNYVEMTVVNRQLSRLEETWVERQYVKVVLKIWLKESLKKAFNYMENKAIDISTKMSTHFNQLKSVNSFYDIPKQNASSQLLSWCKGELFQLILNQKDVFQSNPFSFALVSYYVKHFKTLCTDKVIFRCLSDMAKDETRAKKQRAFISALHQFLNVVHKCNTDSRLQDILEEESLEKNLMDDIVSGKELVNRLLGAISNINLKTEINKSFRLLKEAAESLDDTEWTPQLQSLTKEICKKSLLPITRAEIKNDDGGRRIIVVKGVSVFVGKMITKISGLNVKAHELQIIGIKSVHVDWNLTANDWHGTNVAVLTDKLFIDGDVCWDVSGQHGTNHLHECDREGESGGNVYVACNEMETVNDGQWTIVADGGDGSDGRNGESVTKGNNISTRKWTEEKFKTDFPSMSTFGESKKAMSTVLKTLSEIMPSQNRDHGAKTPLSHQGNFYIEGTAKDGSRITVSFYRKINKVTKKLTKRCTLILCQGGRGGQGGYGGRITFEHLSGEAFVIPSSLLIGRKNLPATEMRTGFYEGLQGKPGKAAGDVGFIHNVNITDGQKNKEGNFIGFNNDVKLKIEYLEHKPHEEVPNSYTSVQFFHQEGHRYAKIIPTENQDVFESSHYSVMEEVGKKKTITRQSLEKYFNHITEQKRMTQSFQAMLTHFSQPSMKQQLGDIESIVNQIESKESFFQHQLTSQHVAEERVGEGQYVKPAFIRRINEDDISNSHTEQILGCYPVDFQSEPQPAVNVRCLNLLPTTGGVDSALHSIFGKINSTGTFLCRDSKRYRQEIANFIRSQEKTSKSGESICNIFTFIEQFVKWRVKNGDMDFPKASSMKDEFQRNNSSINRELTQRSYKCLLEEYAQFVESPSRTLDINEVEILAIDYDITIHIYENQSSSFKYKTTFNSRLNGDRCKAQHFVLYGRGGGWQRLESNDKLQTFCNELDKKFFKISCSVKSSYFSELVGWLETTCFNENITTSVKKLNPLDGETPDELSQLLKRHLEPVFAVGQSKKKRKSNDEEIAKIAADLDFLAEIVLEFNTRNMSHIFYLHIVAKFKPNLWKYEFLLLEIEQRLKYQLSYDEKSTWEKNYLYPLKDRMIFLLRERILAMDQQPHTKYLVFESGGKQLEKILGMLVNDLNDLTEDEVNELGKLPLSDWYYELRCKVWQKRIGSTSTSSINRKEKISLKRRAVYLLLDLEIKHGEKHCCQLIDGIKDLKKVLRKLEEKTIPMNPKNTINGRTKTPAAQTSERKVADIISTMKNDPENRSIARERDQLLEDIRKKVEESKKMQLTGNEITDLISNEWLGKGIDLGNGPSLVKFLYTFDYAVQKIFQKEGLKVPFQLRDTQRVAIMTLLTDYTENKLNESPSKGTLVQVATGEGKSLIVAGVAIAFALSRLPNADKNKRKNKVDVITSNNILAYRDSYYSVDEGGLRNLYTFFKVNVDNNCSQSEYDRVKAYDSDVVYGELSNFQRDYLLDKFYHRNIRGDRTFDFVIVDEVDCMLLDRGNNTLYLSHDIPGIEMLESLYVFIWEKIHQPMKREAIKSAILFDLYGVITKNNLNSIHRPLKDHPSEKNALWNHLIEMKVIDSQGRLLIQDADKITDNTFNYRSKYVQSGLNHHLAFFFRNVVRRERRIRIPEHLLSFVDRHMDTLLDNAYRALQLRPDEDYVVDQDRVRSNITMDLEPQVIIIDQDTGTDQTSSQWDGGLHQFLQLKEGCKVTLQSLKAVFVSNATYIKSYSRIAGVSGTLGSERERKFMSGKFKCNFFDIPTALPKCFTLKPTAVYKTKESWLAAVTQETRLTVLTGARPRSIIIFCRSIKEVNTVYQRLKNNFASLFLGGNRKIHRYTRDYEKLVFESAELDVGHIIVATNLAGRGTDIKISHLLRKNGGLHVCLTYLPDSERVEEQAMGRSGRNGAPGSGILILYEARIDDEEHLTKEETEWHVSKLFSMKDERNFQDLQRISRLEEDFDSIGRQEQFFDEFSQHYKTLKSLLMRKYSNPEVKAVCLSALDKWALWLDQRSEDVKWTSLNRKENHDSDLKKRFAGQLSDCKGSLNDISWIAPARFLTMVKDVAASQTKKVNLSPFNHRLELIIESKDSFFYPAAHYYRAFILSHEEFAKNKSDIIRTLRTCEMILNDYIDMQMSYLEVVNKTQSRSGSESICVVEAYEQQKDNIVKLLRHFICSIWSFMGTNDVSVLDLQIHTGMTVKKAEEMFSKLTDLKYIVCHVNSPNTVPNRDTAIQRVADKNGVKRSSIDEYLHDAEKSKGLGEKEMKKKLKHTRMIVNSRKEFWNYLVAYEVLQASIECGIISQMDCDNMSLDRNERIKMDSQLCNGIIPVLYDPVCTIMDLKENKKIMFKKSYLKGKIDEYHNNMQSLQVPAFGPNKYATLNLDKLKTIDLKSFGQLKKNNLANNDYMNINRNEWPNIWKELRNQNIIDDNGDLASVYKWQEFRYPECPSYENSVNSLIKTTFAVELVRRDWLKAKENPNLLQAITQLPLRPYRDLFNDLFKVHVVSGPRVEENISKDLKKLNVLVKTIEDKQECESVLEFLDKHQPIYVFTRKSGGFSLIPIEREIRERDDISNISTELYIFGLVGFDHAIKIKDQKMSWKTISTITIAGALQLAVGVAMHRHLRRITTNPGVAGIGDILFIIKNLRRNQVPTMSEYLRHKLKQIAQDSSKPISPKDVAESWLVNPKQSHENETNFLERIKNQRRSVTPLEDSTTSVASFDTNNLLNLMDLGITRLNGILDRHCHLSGIKLKKQIKKVVDKNSNTIKETLSHLQRLHGLEKAQRLVNEKLNGLTTGCFERVQERYSEVLAKVDEAIDSAFPPLNETLESEKDMGGILSEIMADLANQIVRVVDLNMEIRHLVVESIWKFHSELQTLKTTSQNCDIEDREMTVDFENKVMTDMKSEMAETIDKTIAFLAQQLTARVTNNLTLLGNSLLCLVENEGDDYHNKEVKRKRRKFRIRFHSSNCILM